MRLLRRRHEQPAGRGDREVANDGTRAEGVPAGSPGARTASDRTAAEGPVESEGGRAPVAERRRGVGGRTRDAGAATAGAVGSGILVLARLVMLTAVLIALLIGAAIALRLVGANASNTIVEGIHEGANFFAGSFTGLIRFSGHPKRELAVDWGIALVVYLIVGALLARLVAGVGYGGLRFERRRRAVPMH